MSIFRLLIASLIFCSASFANAGYLQSGICHSDKDKAINSFLSENYGKVINGLLLSKQTIASSPDSSIVYITTVVSNIASRTSSQQTILYEFPLCTDDAINDAISLAWKIILVWLAAWAIAQLIRIVRTESDGASDYGHS